MSLEDLFVFDFLRGLGLGGRDRGVWRRGIEVLEGDSFGIVDDLMG
jgi:hypothetical protein